MENDGGPAFPMPGPIEGEYTQGRSYGISVRDYFATNVHAPDLIGAALAGGITDHCFGKIRKLLEWPDDKALSYEALVEAEAKIRGMKAEAMLADREASDGNS